MNYKSFGFWTALAGAITLLVSTLGKLFGFSVDNQLVNDAIMSFAGVLVVLGIVTMPKNKKNDKKAEEEKLQEQPENETNTQEEENQE